MPSGSIIDYLIASARYLGVININARRYRINQFHLYIVQSCHFSVSGPQIGPHQHAPRCPRRLLRHRHHVQLQHQNVSVSCGGRFAQENKLSEQAFSAFFTLTHTLLDNAIGLCVGSVSRHSPPINHIHQYFIIICTFARNSLNQTMFLRDRSQSDLHQSLLVMLMCCSQEAIIGGKHIHSAGAHVVQRTTSRPRGRRC